MENYKGAKTLDGLKEYLKTMKHKENTDKGIEKPSTAEKKPKDTGSKSKPPKKKKKEAGKTEL